MFLGSGPTAGGGLGFELRVLGPVQAVRAGRDVALGGPRQRVVLALLVLEAGRVVPAGRLVEDAWEGRPPPGAVKTLRSYVSRLRSALAPEVALAARGGGYMISIGPGQVDAGRFEQLLAGGQEALSSGEAAAAASRFGEALGLWRGPALADVCEVARLAREAARLEELRLTAVEGRVEANLVVGRHGEMIGELESLVAEFPLRERLWRLLVLALYRCGRQAEALAAYRRARDMLADELGLEPGEELRALEQAVLRQEVPAPPPMARHNLPAPLTSFVGRDHDLAELEQLLDHARLVTLTGTGGAGKTRLAVEAAGRMAGRFGDGVWLTELAGLADPELVAAQVMEALGVRQEAGVQVLEALRHRLRSAELLLVLDNCEHLLEVSAQLAGVLLRAAPGLRVLATSREPLGIPGEVAYLVRPLALPDDVADTHAAAGAPAVRLFLDRGAAARGGVSGGVAPVAVAERICRTLDGLPLAIELAAARLGTLSAGEIETRLADRFTFLAHRRLGAEPRHQALQAAVDWSYDLLPAEERRVFRELSVFAGTFGAVQAAAVCGSDKAAALEVIDRLAGKSLMTAEPAEDQTRYRLLDTIRQYAADRLTEAGGTAAARRRHALAFLDLAEQEHRMPVLVPEHDNFRAALDWALAAGDEAGPQLTRALGEFWLARGLLAEGRDWLERALTQPLADQRLRAGLLRLLGTVLYEAGDLARAKAVLADGCQVAAAAGEAALQARIGVMLADIRNLQDVSNAETLTQCKAAIAALDAEGDLQGLAEAWTQAGKLRFWLGDPATAETDLERAIAYARQSGHHRAQMRASHWLAVSFHVLPIPADDAVLRAEQLLGEAIGDPWAEADLLKPLCVLYAYVGRTADARAVLARTRSVFAGFGAKFALAESGIPAGLMELTLQDPVAAERYLRESYEALQTMGERGYLTDITTTIAEALYAQGRFDEAQQTLGEAQALAGPTMDIWPSWLGLQAKLLAQRGEFAAARQLADQAQAFLSPTSSAVDQAAVHRDHAEVHHLAGLHDQAAASLRAALRIYEDRRATLLAQQVKAALASLTTWSDT